MERPRATILVANFEKTTFAAMAATVNEHFAVHVV
jgi:hypothetical protein